MGGPHGGPRGMGLKDLGPRDPSLKDLGPRGAQGVPSNTAI